MWGCIELDEVFADLAMIESHPDSLTVRAEGNYGGFLRQAWTDLSIILSLLNQHAQHLLPQVLTYISSRADDLDGPEHAYLRANFLHLVTVYSSKDDPLYTHACTHLIRYMDLSLKQGQFDAVDRYRHTQNCVFPVNGCERNERCLEVLSNAEAALYAAYSRPAYNLLELVLQLSDRDSAVHAYAFDLKKFIEEIVFEIGTYSYDKNIQRRYEKDVFSPQWVDGIIYDSRRETGYTGPKWSLA